MINKIIQEIIIFLLVLHSACYLHPCDASDTVLFGNSVIPKVIQDIHNIARDGSIELHQLVFSDRHITNALIKAHKNNVTVTLQVSPNLRSFGTKELQRLEDEGITIVYKHTHEKTILLQERGGTNRIMYTGSRNFSNNAYRQPDLLIRLTDKDGHEKAIDDVVNTWGNRKKRKKPVQTVSPVKRIKQAPRRMFNTPTQTRVFASEILSPRQVMRGGLKAIRKTPSKKEVIATIPNTNDKSPDSTRKNLIAEFIEAAQEHPNSSFELIVDEACTKKTDLAHDLQEFNALPNGAVHVFNQYGEENNFESMRALLHMHIKALFINSKMKSSTPALAFISTGNPTHQGVSSPI